MNGIESAVFIPGSYKSHTCTGTVLVLVQGTYSTHSQISEKNLTWPYPLNRFCTYYVDYEVGTYSTAQHIIFSFATQDPVQVLVLYKLILCTRTGALYSCKPVCTLRSHLGVTGTHWACPGILHINWQLLLHNCPDVDAVPHTTCTVYQNLSTQYPVLYFQQLNQVRTYRYTNHTISNHSTRQSLHHKKKGYRDDVVQAGPFTEKVVDFLQSSRRTTRIKSVEPVRIPLILASLDFNSDSARWSTRSQRKQVFRHHNRVEPNWSTRNSNIFSFVQ